MREIYQSKTAILSGTDYREVSRKARAIYDNICKKTKRKPYVRSAYFKKEKIFLDYFWSHLHQKNSHDRLRRLRYYACAIDLIIHSRRAPTTTKNGPESLHRFSGITKDKKIFFVQVKENMKSGQKHLISIFPHE